MLYIYYTIYLDMNNVFTSNLCNKKNINNNIYVRFAILIF